jgi:hypothetical protein
MLKIYVKAGAASLYYSSSTKKLRLLAAPALAPQSWFSCTVHHDSPIFCIGQQEISLPKKSSF